MRDVVVIGGGLSGLSACYELEKHNIRYTVIEVKPRFGGSIVSANDSGFVLDGAGFATQSIDDGMLSELGQDDTLYDMGNGDFGFSSGTESLIQALAGKLTRGRLMRMAVSTIGKVDKRYTICMENGMLYDAGAIIVAVPARYAERLFHSFVPEIADRLRNYHYDTIFRVSLGYHRQDLPDWIGQAYDMNFPFLFYTDHESRVPDSNHVLIQVGVRARHDSKPDDVVQAAIQQYGWGGKPLVKRVHYWSEADPLSCYDDDHHENMIAIKKLLPDGISLIGSDYSEVHPQHRGVARLDDRMRQGREAAQQAISYLKAKKNANT